MSKVWIVTSSPGWEGFEIVAVVSNEEAAKRVGALYPGSYWEEWDVDWAPNPAVSRYYITGVELLTGGCQITHTDNRHKVLHDAGAIGDVVFEGSDSYPYATATSYVSQEHADKLANEAYERYQNGQREGWRDLKEADDGTE